MTSQFRPTEDPGPPLLLLLSTTFLMLFEFASFVLLPNSNWFCSWFSFLDLPHLLSHRDDQHPMPKNFNVLSSFSLQHKIIFPIKLIQIKFLGIGSSNLKSKQNKETRKQGKTVAAFVWSGLQRRKF